MKGTAHRWIAGSIAAVSFITTAGAALGADVTDADRTFRNFTRETATVPEGQVRVEIRGLSVHDEGKTRLNTIGVLQPRDSVKSVSGGIIDLLASYGLGKTAEIGLDIPGVIEEKRPTSGPTVNNSDIGDVLLYGKFKHSVAEHCAVGAALEMTMPNGPQHKSFGSGELGVTPVVSTRYQQGPLGVGGNVAYTTYTGDVPDVFNYGAEIIVRPSELWALRAEIAGRVFHQRGTRWHDLTILPGIDFNLSNNITIRPTFLANGTKSALDWGIGCGVAVSF